MKVSLWLTIVVYSIVVAGYANASGDSITPLSRYPEWNQSTTVLPPLYSEKVKTAVLLPARRGNSPNAVLFEKDYDGFWTMKRLQDIKVEVAVKFVLSGPNEPKILAMYRKISGPGLSKPDIDETFLVIDAPKDELTLVGLEYLCEIDSMDIAIFNNSNSILLNRRIALSVKTKSILKEVRNMLRSTSGKNISTSELKRIIQAYQNKVDLDEIGRTLF